MTDNHKKLSESQNYFDSLEKYFAGMDEIKADDLYGDLPKDGDFQQWLKSNFAIPCLRNDLWDDNDGCVNSMILTAGCITAVTKKRTTILSIREEVDGSVGEDLALTLKLPADIWPEDIDFAPGSKYALMLVRVRE